MSQEHAESETHRSRLLYLYWHFFVQPSGFMMHWVLWGQLLASRVSQLGWHSVVVVEYMQFVSALQEEAVWYNRLHFSRHTIAPWRLASHPQRALALQVTWLTRFEQRIAHETVVSSHRQMLTAVQAPELGSW